MPGIHRFLALSLSTALTTSAFAAPSVSDLVRKYSDLKLGAAQRVTNVSITNGHATFTIPSAVAAAVMAGDEQVGVFYNGPGTFTYTTTEKVEFPLVRYNARSAKVKLEPAADKIVINDSFKSLFLWEKSRPAITASSEPRPDESFNELRQTFTHQWGATPEQHFARQLLDAPTAKLQYAHIYGDRFYIHTYDEALDREESLDALSKFETNDRNFKGNFGTVMLSRQMIGRDIRDPLPPRFMLTDADITIVASDKNDATISVTETVVPLKRAASVFRFDLKNHDYVEFNVAPRNYNVKSVTDDQGHALSFDHNGNEVVVSLPSPAPSGQPVKLHFEIDGDFLFRPGGDNYWELGVEPWFPLPNLSEQSFTAHLLVKVKPPFIPFSPGKMIRRATEDGYNVVETRLEQPVQFLAVLAGKYHVEEETRNGITVRIASYASSNKMMSKTLTNLAYSIIDYYQWFLGPFPFTELNVIEKNELGYGQAPAGTVFITKEAFQPKDREANEYVKGINARYAHEIAHQYWGTVVKMPSLDEQWITEAFAEYSAALFMKAMKGDSGYQTMLTEWKTGESRDARDTAPIPLANYLYNKGDRLGGFLARQGLIYFKGALILAALHQELGDQQFLTFMKSYQKSFRWKFGTTRDVAGLLQFMTKKDYMPFFEQYYWGMDTPQVKR